MQTSFGRSLNSCLWCRQSQMQRNLKHLSSFKDWVIILNLKHDEKFKSSYSADWTDQLLCNSAFQQADIQSLKIPRKAKYYKGRVIRKYWNNEIHWFEGLYRLSKAVGQIWTDISSCLQILVPFALLASSRTFFQKSEGRFSLLSWEGWCLKVISKWASLQTEDVSHSFLIVIKKKKLRNILHLTV